MAGRMMVSMLGGGHNTHQLRELLHLMRHAWHQVKEDFEILTERDDDK